MKKAGTHRTREDVVTDSFPAESLGLESRQMSLPVIVASSCAMDLTTRAERKDYSLVPRCVPPGVQPAYNSDGKVYAECHADHKTETFLGVFRRHISTCPEDEQIHYVMDNHSTHISYPFCQTVAELSGIECPLAKALDNPSKRADWLRSSDKRIIIHFTPYHGSWLNLQNSVI